jgi:NAD(P)-dependent dehydrogenase (short-subunit alcohol dehydrogenase family)
VSADGPLAGEVAIVTGAGAGIGRAIARTLADSGARVMLVDRDAEAGQRAAGEINAGGGRAEPVPVDLARVDDVTRMVRAVHENAGRVDILVNNAAVTRASTFFEVGLEEWDTILAVNARGAFFCMQEAARIMVAAGRGRIVNIASVAGKGWGGSSSAAYAASKGAMLAMTRYAAMALASDGVTVNAVCPGLTATATFEQVVRDRAREADVPYDEYVARYAEQIPLGRVNSPADIAAAVLFLVSPQGRNITGQSLNVDGGLVFD